MIGSSSGPCSAANVSKNALGKSGPFAKTRTNAGSSLRQYFTQSDEMSETYSPNPSPYLAADAADDGAGHTEEPRDHSWLVVDRAREFGEGLHGHVVDERRAKHRR